jgi:hypothetical protein
MPISILLILIILIILGKEYKFMNLLIKQFSPNSYHFSSTPCFQTLSSSRSSLHYQCDQVSHPYRTTDKIIIQIVGKYVKRMSVGYNWLRVVTDGGLWYYRLRTFVFELQKLIRGTRLHGTQFGNNCTSNKWL